MANEIKITFTGGSLLGGLLGGGFFRAAFSPAGFLSVNENADRERLGMVRAILPDEDIFDLSAFLLDQLLQGGLIIPVKVFFSEIAQNVLQNKGPGTVKTAVQIHGADQGFDGIGYDGVLQPASHLFLPSSETKIIRET